MNTNLDYENASAAIMLIKKGMDVNNAVDSTNAKIQLVNIMLGNEDVITEDVFVEDSIRLERESICLSCNKNINNTCMECACPLPTITNMKFKICPLEKWQCL
jgi:hypothetical protein